MTGGQTANFTCLAAARHAVLEREGWDVARLGLQGAPRVRILAGEDAHVTLFSPFDCWGSAMRRWSTSRWTIRDECRPPTSNGGWRNERPADRVRPGRERQLRGDRSAALPSASSFHSTAGGCTSTARSGYGPLPALLCDTSSTGSTSPTPGRSTGTSVLNVPYDCGIAVVRDAAAHRATTALTASYLPPAPGDARDPSSFVPESSRRARGFAIWAARSRSGRRDPRRARRPLLRARSTVRGSAGRRAGSRDPQRRRPEPGPRPLR